MSQIEKYCNNFEDFERIGEGSYSNIIRLKIKKQKVMLQLKKLIKDDINH